MARLGKYSTLFVSSIVTLTILISYSVHATGSAEESVSREFAQPGDGFKDLEELDPFQSNARGFFWGDTPTLEEEPAEEPEPSPLPPETPTTESPTESEPQETKPAGPRPFSAQWVKENLPVYKLRAVDVIVFEVISRIGCYINFGPIFLRGEFGYPVQTFR